MDNGVSKSDYIYNSRNLLTSEIQTLAGRAARTVAYDYDADGLRTDLVYPGAHALAYAWTARAQLHTVVAGTPPPLATYTYDKAGRNTGVSHENGITQQKTWDAASQLLANTHLKGSIAVSGHGYTLDSTGRRTGETFADGSTPARGYGYDDADQVTSATYGGGQSDSYDYDPMGNRTSASIASQGGGTVNYGTANNVNQYTSVTGLSPISHDANGNLLLQNGVSYEWDSENRLLSVTPGSPALGDKSLVHTYDGQHRRVTRTVREWTASGWLSTSITHFIYDGWNVIEEYELTTTTSTLVRSLTWGTDLSGSLQGAGGVGGLLMVEEIGVSTATAYHFHYDGNGNVTEITDSLGDPAASYRYDAFGNTLGTPTGSYASQNRYRFSTKPLDGEVTNAPLYYYGYRYYDPLRGRWPSRDPIGERGGVNLYGFVGNNGVNRCDNLGLEIGDYEKAGAPEFDGTATRSVYRWKWLPNIRVNPKDQCEVLVDAQNEATIILTGSRREDHEKNHSRKDQFGMNSEEHERMHEFWTKLHWDIMRAELNPEDGSDHKDVGCARIWRSYLVERFFHHFELAKASNARHDELAYPEGEEKNMKRSDAENHEFQAGVHAEKALELLGKYIQHCW